MSMLCVPFASTNSHSNSTTSRKQRTSSFRAEICADVFLLLLLWIVAMENTESWCLIASIHLYQVITASVRFVVISKFMSAVVCIQFLQLLACRVFIVYWIVYETGERALVVWKYAIYGRTWAINIYRQHDRLHRFLLKEMRSSHISHMRRFYCVYLFNVLACSLCAMDEIKEWKETSGRLVFLAAEEGTRWTQRWRWSAYKNGKKTYTHTQYT